MIGRNQFNQFLRNNLIVIILLGSFCYPGCQKKENNCLPSEVAFDLEIDLTSVLDHESTNQTTHVKIYFEDYNNLGNLQSYKDYAITESKIFKSSICLPINEVPTDSIIIALKLIQNNAEAIKDPVIYLNVPFSKSDVNCIVREINSTYLWNRPSCETMPTVFQNIEVYIEGERHNYDIFVAGGFGIGLNAANIDSSLDDIKLIGDEDLLDYYIGGLCPCSKYYVKFK